MIRHRLEQYHGKTEPLVDYYDHRACCGGSTAPRPPDEVGEEIRSDPGDDED